MKAKIFALLLMAGMSIGLVDDVYGQSRRQRVKNKWKRTFGTPRNPKRPPAPKFVAPPAPPAARKPVPPPPPPAPPRPPKPPVPR